MHRKGTIQQIIFILIISLIIGLGTNFSLVKKYFQGEFQYGFISSVEYSSILLITQVETEELFSKEKALFIDSRNKEAYRAGHISGSINIPFIEHKKKEKIDLLSFPFEKTLVVYCEGSGCQYSISLAKLLHKKGYKDIRVFLGGWREWAAKGLPMSKDDSK